MVINRDTEIKNCVDIALRQDFNNKILKDIYEENYIKFLHIIKYNNIFIMLLA